LDKLILFTDNIRQALSPSPFPVRGDGTETCHRPLHAYQRTIYNNSEIQWEEHMADKEQSMVIGVFVDREQAARAVDALDQAGFGTEQIGILSPASTELTGEITDQTPKPKSVITGAAGGGTLGALLGAGTALLIPGIGPALAGGIFLGAFWGAAIGSVAGGLIGAFVSVGIPEEEARYYQSELEKGHTLVTVKAENRTDDALKILHQHGAYDATNRESRPSLPGKSAAPITSEEGRTNPDL
jgi:hypothetical protein